ncbi:MAG: class I SAM-dependent methyltransferase [Gammaproteobacteria bacterium]|nr:class I SAM-dependent methyltransferase [Gammaproteobacteria bacterium]
MISESQEAKENDVEACRARILSSLRDAREAIRDYRRIAVKDDDFFLEKPAPELPAEALEDVRVYPNRTSMMVDLPHNALVAELGTERGIWARQIMLRNPPAELHLFDLSFELLRADVLGHALVTIHAGDSSEQLSRMPDGYFDWIYVDGDHSYRGVKRDIEQSVRKLKADGILVFNDYTVWSSKSAFPYGVVTAVNELVNEGWRLCALALSPNGYWDVALARRA